MKTVLYCLVLCLAISCTAPQPLLPPTRLTCEYVNNPSVVDVAQPRLAWINQAPANLREQKQTAWQIRVASSQEMLSQPDLWNSEKVDSEQCFRIAYSGKELSSHQTCWWQVRVWNQDGVVSPWSEPASWKMGILDSSEWKATWIGAPWQGETALPQPTWPGAPVDSMPPPAPLLRKSFNLNKEPIQAIAYVIGLGYFELYANGDKIGDDVLVPNQTNYAKRENLMQQNIPLPDQFEEYRVMYLAYDITENLQKGKNVLGAVLGNGFYNPAKYWAGSYGTPRFFGQVHISYADGTSEIITSDTSWKASQSPILMDMVYYGETYDAREEKTNWAKSGYDDSDWAMAVQRNKPYGKLIAHTPHTDKITQRLKPVSISETDSGTYVVDFGVEISGWVKLEGIQADAGHEIDIKFLSNLYSGDNKYICKGGGTESYAPRFNWFIFKEIEIFNWPGPLRADQLTAEAVNTYVEESATFQSSNELFNQINTIWRQSQIDNMHGGIASDCPHRERSPYTGDAQVACNTVLYNYDARSFYQKWIQDIRGAQIEATGYVPNCAPWQPGCGGGVAWGAAICIMPWEFYRHYGSMDMLEDNYKAMKGYTRYMRNWVDEDGIMYSQRTGKDSAVLKWFNLGDWACVNDSCPPDDMVHTFYLWKCARITSETAKALGKVIESKEYAALAERTKKAFHQRFYNSSEGSYGQNGANVFALHMGIEGARYERVVSSLKKEIKANGNHLITGIFGTRFFFETLSDHGMHDLAFEAMNQRTYPSFGYWLEDGATTTREHWDNGGSHNHPMFGGGIAWFYNRLAGMRLDSQNVAYKHIIFKPMLVEEVDSVAYYNETSYGKAGINWKQDSARLVMDISVPVGSSATVHIPAYEGPILEGKRNATQAKGVKFLRMEEDYALYEVQSGSYHFIAEKTNQKAEVPETN